MEQRSRDTRRDQRPPRGDCFAASRAFAGLLAVEAVSDRAFPRHTHDQFGIGVVVHGAQHSASGRGPVTAKAGQVITVYPNEVHDGIPLSNRARAWKMIYLDTWLMYSLTVEIGPGRELHHPVLTARNTAGMLLSLHEAVMAGRCVEDTAQNLLPLILHPLFSLTNSRSAVGAAGIRRAIARIDDAPELAHPVAALAAEAGLSPWHFIRAFTKTTGLTPQAYRRQRQLQKARSAIDAGSALSEAAAMSGFADQSHMTRLFARSYGLTPGTLAAASRSRLRAPG